MEPTKSLYINEFKHALNVLISSQVASIEVGPCSQTLRFGSLLRSYSDHLCLTCHFVIIDNDISFSGSGRDPNSVNLLIRLVGLTVSTTELIGRNIKIVFNKNIVLIIEPHDEELLEPYVFTGDDIYPMTW